MKKIKTFYGGSWIRNSERVDSIDEADIIVMPGGSDWNPRLYGQEPNTHTRYFSEQNDAHQMGIMKEAVAKGKMIFGICRGLQGLTILNGGTLIQHVSHGGSHPAHFFDGRVINTNSIHHQMCNPYNLPREEYEVLAWTGGLSPVYIGERDQAVVWPPSAYKDGIIAEPEVIYYPKTRSLGAQSHPEMMREGEKFQDRMNDLIWELFETGTIQTK